MTARRRLRRRIHPWTGSSLPSEWRHIRKVIGKCLFSIGKKKEWKREKKWEKRKDMEAEKEMQRKIEKWGQNTWRERMKWYRKEREKRWSINITDSDKGKDKYRKKLSWKKKYRTKEKNESKKLNDKNIKHNKINCCNIIFMFFVGMSGIITPNLVTKYNERTWKNDLHRVGSRNLSQGVSILQMKGC